MRSAISACASASKTDGSQSLNLQYGALETAGVDEVDVYRDLASGVRDDPAGLDGRQRALRKGDVLVVWKLNRLGRSLDRLVDAVQGPVSPRRGPAGGRRRRGADRRHDRGRARLV